MFAYMPPPPPTAIEHVIYIDNPLLGCAYQLQYNQIEARHFVPAYRVAFDNVKLAMDQMVFSEEMSVHEFITCIECIEHSKETIEQTFNLFLDTMDSSDLRVVSQDLGSLCIDCDNFLYHHPTMLAFLNHFKSETVFPTLTALEQRMIKKRYDALFMQGAFLTGEDRAEFIEAQKKLAGLTRTFNNNINDSSKTAFVSVYDKDQLKGIPKADVKTAFYNYHGEPRCDMEAQEGPWAFTLDYHTRQSILKYGESRELRRSILVKANEIAVLPPYSNKEVIKSILTVRQKLAHLLRFENYTAMSLYTKMAKDSDSIVELFSEIEDKAKAAKEKEQAKLQGFAMALDFEGDLQDWDLAFYANKLEETLFSIDFEEMKAYFSLDHVLATLFDFSSKLFDISIAQKEKRAWHSDVLFYEVTDNQGAPLASFYVDPFARIGVKGPGAWMDAIDSRWNERGKQHLPITYIATNFKKPEPGSACLLSLREVETIFHEFGHTLQHILSKEDYKTLSSINSIEWDGVEIASQLMENWVYYKPLLKKLASHHETGATLSDEMMDNIVKSRQFNNGSRMLYQIALSKLDLILHGDYDPRASRQEPGDIFLDLLEKATFNPEPYARAYPCRFSHIFGGDYAAGFYSYLYAEIRSADLFAAFEEVGFDEAQVALLGTLYKETFLELGGSLDPDEVFMLFRLRSPSSDAIIRHLGLRKKQPIN